MEAETVELDLEVDIETEVASESNLKGVERKYECGEYKRDIYQSREVSNHRLQQIDKRVTPNQLVFLSLPELHLQSAFKT